MGELRSFVSFAFNVAAAVAFGCAVWHAMNEHYEASIAYGVLAMCVGMIVKEERRG